MQPYFMPYIGYFQLIAAVDLFVVYDNIQYTKKGWINRNRFLRNGVDHVFSIPLKAGSDFLDVCNRELAEGFDRNKLLNQLTGAYRGAPHFATVFPFIKNIIECTDTNLFAYLHHALIKTCEQLRIHTRIIVSSSVPVDHSLKNQDRVLAICSAVGAQTYINAIGGTSLYASEPFRAKGIDLQFLQPSPVKYDQFGNVFVPALSIIDLLMFNTNENIQSFLAPSSELR